MNGGINQVAQIQETPFASGRSIYDGAVLNGLDIRGRIMSTISTNDYAQIVFQDGRGPLSGVILTPGNSGATDIDTRLRGDSIQITSARVFENLGITSMEVLAYNFVSAGQPYAPVNVPMDSILARCYEYTEAYESMLLEYNDVFVVNQNPDAPSNFGEFAIYPDSLATNGLRVRGGVGQSSPAIGLNFNTDSVSLGQKLAFIRGILSFNFGNWKLQPRNHDDIAGFSTINTTSVSEISSNSRVSKLYPNPNKGAFTLEVTAQTPESVDVAVTDMTGRVLYRQPLFIEGNQQLNLDIPGLSPGMYLVSLQGQATSQHVRFVVNR